MAMRIVLQIKYLPLDQLSSVVGGGVRRTNKITVPCFYCKGEGEDVHAEPWKRTEECPACRGEKEQESVVVAKDMFLYIFLSRWLWELVTEKRSLDPEEDQPWSGDADAWRGGD